MAADSSPGRAASRQMDPERSPAACRTTTAASPDGNATLAITGGTYTIGTNGKGIAEPDRFRGNDPVQRRFDIDDRGTSYANGRVRDGERQLHGAGHVDVRGVSEQCERTVCVRLFGRRSERTRRIDHRTDGGKRWRRIELPALSISTTTSRRAVNAISPAEFLSPTQRTGRRSGEARPRYRPQAARLTLRCTSSARIGCG